MKVQEVILRAIDGKLTWPQAADILGCSPGTAEFGRPPADPASAFVPLRCAAPAVCQVAAVPARR
jgi:hypothetical protein